MADGFIWYELVTNDMDKAVSFYKKVVGVGHQGRRHARLYLHALR